MAINFRKYKEYPILASSLKEGDFFFLDDPKENNVFYVTDSQVLDFSNNFVKTVKMTGPYGTGFEFRFVFNENERVQLAKIVGRVK